MTNDPKDARRIKVTKDGPYVVSGNVPLAEEDIVVGSDGEPARWDKGPSFPVRETYALCRCGASKDKPFCDGSHVEAGVRRDGDGRTRPLSRERGKNGRPGGRPDIFRGVLCLRALLPWREGRLELRRGLRRPRGPREGASKKPAPARREASSPGTRTTGAAIEPACEPGISLIEDPRTGLSGPLWVKGAIPVESADGVEYERRNRVTLCRCGRSERKPFCDGSHLDAGFKSKP